MFIHLISFWKFLYPPKKFIILQLNNSSDPVEGEIITEIPDEFLIKIHIEKEFFYRLIWIKKDDSRIVSIYPN